MTLHRIIVAQNCAFISGQLFQACKHKNMALAMGESTVCPYSPFSSSLIINDFPGEALPPPPSDVPF